MDVNAKKVSITIIVILIGVIGGLWYVGNKKSHQVAKTDLLVATTSNQTLDPEIRAAYAVSDQEMENLISAVAQATSTDSKESTKIYQDVYSLANIKLSNDESTASLISYGKQAGEALKSLGTQTDGAQLALAAIAQGDLSATVKLKELSRVYQETEKKLAVVRTPKSAAVIQLKILNSLNKLSQMLSDMSRTNDPETALINSSLYQLSLPALYTAFNDLNKYFITKGIKFDDKDQVRL